MPILKKSFVKNSNGYNEKMSQIYNRLQSLEDTCSLQPKDERASRFSKTIMHMDKRKIKNLNNI